MRIYLDKFELTKVVAFAKSIFYLSILALTILGAFQYKGQLYVYIIFSIASNTLLFFSFRKNAIFFDTFIGFFFWMGFGLKLTVRICLGDNMIGEAIGEFNGSGEAYDRALLVAACGMFGLISASMFREKYIFNYPKKPIVYTQNGMLNFYKNYRNFILIGFAVLFLAVAITNIYFGIYQRGEVTKTTLPFGLNGIYKWLLLFGMASIAGVILQCELVIKKQLSYWVVILSLMESFSTSVSMLSRGMILNSAALIYGVYVYFKINALKLNIRFITTSLLLFALLFVASVYVANYIRASSLSSNFMPVISGNDVKTIRVTEQTGSSKLADIGIGKSMFLDRWVGMEGVMAVSSHPRLGWDFWLEAWQEKYSENVISFYDKNLIKSPYENLDFTTKHHVSLPGILAFLFYSGSFVLLFAGMFILGLFAATIEMLTYKLGGNNLILCALLAEVVAYRYVSFGYVPAQSYLLFGTIFINLFIIYSLDKVLTVWDKKKIKSSIF